MLKFCLGLGCGAILAGSVLLFSGTAQAGPGAPAYDVRVVGQPGPFNREAAELGAQGYEAKGVAATGGGLYIVMQKRVR